MQRIGMVVLLAGVFIAGSICGSLFTPVARADKLKHTQYITPSCPCNQGNPLPYYGPNYLPNGVDTMCSSSARWQVMVVPAADHGQCITVMMDTSCGESFILQEAESTPCGYTWTRVARF